MTRFYSLLHSYQLLNICMLWNFRTLPWNVGRHIPSCCLCPQMTKFKSVRPWLQKGSQADDSRWNWGQLHICVCMCVLGEGANHRPSAMSACVWASNWGGVDYIREELRLPEKRESGSSQPQEQTLCLQRNCHLGLSPAQGPQDTRKTQGTDERFFSGDFERTSGAGATLLWHRVVELPKGREGGEGTHPLASRLSLWLLQPGPQSGSSGLQSLLAVTHSPSVTSHPSWK